MSKLQIVKEIHNYARKNFERRKVSIFSIGETIQSDLIEMQPFKSENRGYRYILIAIDIFSKMLYAEPLLNKTASATTKAMERIFRKIYNDTNRPIRNLHTDNGREYYNSEMKQLLDKHKINHYSTYSIMKASIIERAIRTWKKLMYMEFSMQGSYKWIHKLDQIIDNYNNTL